jgi:hypothetical protein
MVLKTFDKKPALCKPYFHPKISLSKIEDPVIKNDLVIITMLRLKKLSYALKGF